jgi:hypothetical protein
MPNKQRREWEDHNRKVSIRFAMIFGITLGVGGVAILGAALWLTPVLYEAIRATGASLPLSEGVLQGLLLGTLPMLGLTAVFYVWALRKAEERRQEEAKADA